MQKNKGFVLVFAIVMTVALQATVVGSFLNMMRHEREIQRISHQNQAQWLSEGVIDRTLKIFNDYIRTKDKFPAVDANNFVTGNDSSVTNNKSFSEFMKTDWYNSFESRFPQPLNQIEITNYTVKQLDNGATQRHYEITIGIHHLITDVRLTVTQQVLVRKGRLFDFSVFYNEDLEIAPGPNLTIQGPLFSNKNVYLMNHNERTLTLLRPDDFADPENLEPYVLHSAGNIYFYFKRMMGKNYMLENPVYQAAIASGGIPAYYKTDDSTFSGYPFNDGTELYPPSYNLNSTDGRIFGSFPYFYYPANGPQLGSQNIIQVEDENGVLVQLQRPSIQSICTAQENWKECVEYTTNYSGNQMSASSGLNPKKFPKLDSEWQAVNPTSDNPERNTAWQGVDTVVLERQPKKTIPIGDPALDTHVLIEPLSDSDSEKVRTQKFQTKADLAIHCESSDCSGTYMPSDDHGGIDQDQGVYYDFGFLGGQPSQVMNIKPFYDYRIQTCLPVLEINIGHLVDYLRNNGYGASVDDGFLLYVETRPSPFVKDQACQNWQNGQTANVIKLIGGEKLPQKGLTFVTNGRLWIQGNYNTYDYSKGRNCTAEELETENCTVPPAAVFSDSFGVLSNEWQDSYGASTPKDSRRVDNDVIVNVAVGTGTVSSGLKALYTLCASAQANCELDPTLSGGSNWGGLPWFLTGYSGFSCPGGLNSTTGLPNVPGTAENPSDCEYYKDPTTGIYYLYKLSKFYKKISTLCSETITSNCVTVRDYRVDWRKIPIFADATQIGNGSPSSEPPGIRPFPGVYFGTLNKYQLYAVDRRCTPASIVCNDPSIECFSLTCDPVTTGKSCIEPSNDYPEYQCVYAPCRNQTTIPGSCQDYGFKNSVVYMRYHIPLYSPKYSGGFENLINLQEHWTETRSLRFSGVLSSLWESKELSYGPGLPVYLGQAESYYSAPSRAFDYNEDLKNNPPPATPSVFSIERQQWKLKRGNQ